MRWVYILRCEDDYYYVGETKRLYRRFWEHNKGCGGLNTSIYRPEGIVAIYKVTNLGNFFEYNSNVIDTINNQAGYDKWLLKSFNDDVEYGLDNLDAENNITECLMTHKKDEWNKIRGGKYTRFNVEYKYPNNNYVKELPLCKCGLPCDIRKNEDKNYLYFRCAKKNMWEDFKDIFDIDEEPCNFYMEYTTDKQFRIEETNKFQERKNALKELFKKSFWLENVEIDDEDELYPCVGGCNRRSPSIKLTYHNEKRNLCFDCFINKNEELSKKYNFLGGGKCLLKIK
jgi:hypothetical protein